MNGTKIIYLRRKLIAAGACALAAVMMFWVVNHPAVVGGVGLHPAAAHLLCAKGLQGAVHQL